MSISIIIPTLNRPVQLLKILDRLTKITLIEEIIVVDDSNNSQKNEINERYTYPIKYISRGEKLGVSSARNYGAKVARGEYLIFLDDDDDFTNEWLNDYKLKLSLKPDLVHCNMREINTKGDEKLVLNRGDKRLNVIPGAWMIKKSFFLEENGFDERLKFGENTELFFRLDRKKPKEVFIDKVNFIYRPSIDGGSKNVQNMLDSNSLVLEKHYGILSNHIKYLYHQSIGVIHIRFRNFGSARDHLIKALRFKPWKLATWARLGLAFLPVIARKIYTSEVRYD